MPSISGQLNSKSSGKMLNIMELGGLDGCKRPPGDNGCKVSARGCIVTDCHMNSCKTQPRESYRNSGCSCSIVSSDRNSCHCIHSKSPPSHGYKPVDTKVAIDALKQFLHITCNLPSNGASTVAIDNKIEQAMDLVKSHLMFAVREEVIVLKEQIKELLEKNAQLENENYVLRQSASPDTLAQLHQNTAPSGTSSS